MILKVYSVYDYKVKAYLPPFYLHADGHALRALSDLMRKSPDHYFARFPKEHALFCLGEWDDSNARFALDSLPTLICNLNDLVGEQPTPAT